MKWLRLWTDILDDHKIAQLTDYEYRFFTMLLCIASEIEENGVVNMTSDQIAWRLRQKNRKVKVALNKLCELEILCPRDGGFYFKNWDKRQFTADNSTGRVRKYRERREGLGLSKGVSYGVQDVLIRDKFSCVYCGKNENLCVDHAYPIIKGGTDDKENLVAACKECNSGKAGRTPEEAGFVWKNNEARERYLHYKELLQNNHVTVTVTPSEQNRDRTDSDSDSDTYKNKKPPNPLKGKEYTIAFETFWKAYPGRSPGSKEAAFKSWKKRSDLPTLEVLIKHLDRQNRERSEASDKKIFVAEWPMVATYLNNGRWADVYLKLDILETEQGWICKKCHKKTNSLQNGLCNTCYEG